MNAIKEASVSSLVAYGEHERRVESARLGLQSGRFPMA